MIFTRRTVEDIVDQNDSGKLFDNGWYCLTVMKQPEIKTAESSQPYLNSMFRVCKEEGNPDSVTGAPIFDITMLPKIENEDQFLQVLKKKEEAKGHPTDADSLRAVMKKRISMADDGCANLAFALFGYDDFPPVPRKDSEGRYFLPDGTEVKGYNERQVYYKVRKAAAINKLLDVAEGEIDITKYMVYGFLTTETYKGNEKNVIKKFRYSLPDGEKLAKVG